MLPTLPLLLQAGATALMWAANGGHLDMVKALLDLGADPNLRDNVSIFAVPKQLKFIAPKIQEDDLLSQPHDCKVSMS